MATARLNMTTPAGSDLISSGDTVLSDAYNKIDDAMGAKNTATPGTITPAFTGKIAYDTAKVEGAFYTGSAWGFSGGEDNIGRGLDQISSNAAQTDNSGTDVFLISCTFTAVSGRRYLCRYQGFTKYNNVNLGKHSFKFRWAAGSSINASSTLLETHDFEIVANAALGKPVAGSIDFSPGVSGQVTVGIYWNSASATGRINPSGDTFLWSVLHWGT